MTRGAILTRFLDNFWCCHVGGGAWTKKTVLQHFLPLGFLVALVWAMLWPYPGEAISEWQVGDYRLIQTINVCTIFIISGLTLKTTDIMAALKAYVGFLYGAITILIITPCLGFALVKIPFSTPEFATGLAIFAAVPTTLTSGVTLVVQAYGNGALALMLTVCTNMLGILTTPFAISVVIGGGSSIDIDATRLVVKLACTILVPLLVGKAVRETHVTVQRFVTRYKTLLSLTSSVSLVCIVWQTLSRSQEGIMKQSVVNILEALAGAIAMHLVFLAFNFVGVGILRLSDRERKAVLIMASQKTLPVTVTVISFLKESEVGDLGLITIPCVIAHISQLFIDAYIVGVWIAKYEAQEIAPLLSDDAGDKNPKNRIERETNGGQKSTSTIKTPDGSFVRIPLHGFSCRKNIQTPLNSTESIPA
ncbi:hypothetical protein BSKO_02656 [Bryopsis sp. KO-2023]|nr:hypothetical protein BSKO_02656 [Bryopsis sp. KO-2023]